MIKIEIKDSLITVKGHANYDELGKDIVCASVSSIVTTTVNAILMLENTIDYDDSNGVVIKVLNKTEITNTLLENMINLLEQLEKQYPKYIKIGRCIS